MDVETIQLIDEDKASELLAVKVQTLQGWRVDKKGPKFIRISRKCVRYSVADLREWLAHHTIEPMSRITEEAIR